jgi:hypothetical protein
MAMGDWSDSLTAPRPPGRQRRDCEAGRPDLGRRCRPLIRTGGSATETSAAELGASERKVATERDILREAAKHFAGEASW